jgi:tetratricopeptide (TPR) repeat protein
VVKPHLLRAIDVLRADSVREADVAAALVRYARVLENSADWMLAVDVYRTVLRAPSIQEDPVAVHCWLRVGHCYRNLNAQRRAVRAFKRSARLANRTGDKSGYMLAQLGLVGVHIRRGNLQIARERCDRIAKRSRRLGLMHVESKALHSRAEILYLTGKYGGGLRLLYGALRLCKDDLERDRIVGDIACGFLNLGLLGIAQYWYAVLAIRGHEHFVRWTAHSNLLEIASQMEI